MTPDEYTAALDGVLASFGLNPLPKDEPPAPLCAPLPAELRDGWRDALVNAIAGQVRDENGSAAGYDLGGES